MTVTQQGQTNPPQVGQITLSNFINPNGLSPSATTCTADPGQRRPHRRRPRATGLGTIQQSSLEGSNVDMATEMVNMIVGQRAYEANSKTIQTCDQMLQLVNNLKR